MLFSGFPNLTAQWDETKEVASFEGKTKLTANFRGRCQRDYNSSISRPGILTARSIVGIFCPYNVVINIWFSGTARFFFFVSAIKVMTQWNKIAAFEVAEVQVTAGGRLAYVPLIFTENVRGEDRPN